MKKTTVALIFAMLLSTFNTVAGNFFVTVKMKNGDILSGKSTLNKLNIKTNYGELNIPAENITNIQLGILTDKTKEVIVVAELKKLQVSNAKDAETIFNKLLNMGTSILGIVKAFTESNAYQISESYNFSVEELLQKLYSKADLEYGTPINDVIEFDIDSKIDGNITLNEIQLVSNYGTLNLKRENIQSIQLTENDNEIFLGDNVFKLNANKHITGNSDDKGWVNTSIKVKPGSTLTVTASGKIILKSLSGGIYGPDGFIGGKTDSAYDAQADIPYGTLVYKIGETGIAKKIGSKANITVEEEGILYLSIYETVYNQTNTGSYTVKVVIK